MASTSPPLTGDPALDAMRRHHATESENDGSKRLYCVACRAVEHNLTDDAAIATIREYEKEHPFPRQYDDAEILQRIRDAEKQAKRGDVIRRTTDIGNGERFADQHGGDIRYCHEMGKFFVWDGRKWPIDTTGEVVRRAKRTARSIVAEAQRTDDPDMKEKLTKWSYTSEDNKRINAMLALAKSEQPIPIAVESLDADPWLLNCEDGTINLRTGQLREHRREDYLTKCAPVRWSDAEPKLWLEFLDKIFAGNQSLIAFMQRLMGYSLVGEVREHILPIFYGSGANGKSVYVTTWLGMMGDYGCKAAPGLLIASRSKSHPTELANLHGKRLVAASETDENIRLSEALVKDLTGGEKISARRMREDFWDFVPSHTVVLSSNHKPTIKGTDHGIWRRVLLVPFNVTIAEAEQDKELTSKLKAEYPAILRWAVQGCLDWQRDGLNPPNEVRTATDTYRQSMDLIGEFLEECCEAGDKVKASDLYATYRRWAAERSEEILTNTAFGFRMAERHEKRKISVNYYMGLKLK